MSSADPLRPLLEAAREGDDRALNALVRATQPAVWRLCSILGHPGEPADLAQETYLRAIRSMRSYRGEAPVLAWLLSIARRTCADHVRRTQRQRRIVERIGRFTSPVESVVDDSTQIDNGALIRMVHHLDADRREAFVLTQYVGLSYDEAAMVMECPVGTIRSRVARARADLMAAIESAESDAI